LWHGLQSVVETGQADGANFYVIKDALTGWSKLMTFVVEFGFSNHKSTVTTAITTYMTTRPSAYGIPIGPSAMSAHHTYVQFITKLANTVRLADSTANITLIDGASTQPVPVPPPASTVAVPRGEVPTVPWAESPPLTAAPAIPQMATVPEATELPHVPAVELDETTKVVTRIPRGNPTWIINSDGLSRTPISAPVSLGRDPRSSGSAGESLISVPATEWTVSKTHARMHALDGVLYITDLDSTNGTFLIDEHDNMVQCAPNVATVVPMGSGIELGAYGIVVDREAGPRS
jgi:hypothetical protein